MSDLEETYDQEFAEASARRARRMRLITWTVIGAMVLVGGGATVLSLIFG